MSTIRPSLCALSLAFALSACAGAGPNASFEDLDPYEGTNRTFHEFNLALDRNVLRPVSKGYDFVTPTLFKHLFGNITNHVDTVGDFANYVLQGDVEPALTALGRFTINSIIGGAGFLDPATEFGLPKEDTDFGITLGKYGIGEGAYLVLPFLGPTTTRDVGGAVVDRAFNPLTYVGIFSGALAVDIGLPANTVVGIVDQRDRNGDLIDEVLYESVDSYVSLRSIYLQRRRALIAGGETETDALPDIFDDEAPAQ